MDTDVTCTPTMSLKSNNYKKKSCTPRSFSHLPDLRLDNIPLAYTSEQWVALKKGAKKNSKYDLYISALTVQMQSPLIIKEMESFLHSINQVTKYMLVGKSTTQKRKKKDLFRDPDGNLIKPARLDADLIRYYGYKKLEKSKTLLALDVIKAYKKMEQIVLSNTDPTKLEDLALGPFHSIFCDSISSLTKLLLSTKLLPEDARKANLEVAFSAIVIYRQFKVKAVPKFDTLLQEYNGSLPINCNPNFEIQSIER